MRSTETHTFKVFGYNHIKTSVKYKLDIIRVGGAGMVTVDLSLGRTIQLEKIDQNLIASI